MVSRATPSPRALLGDRKGRPYIFIRQIRSVGRPQGSPLHFSLSNQVDRVLTPDESQQAADASGRFVAGDLASL